ncbi:MAG TPA: cation diffusion facilitator family transporter [Pirellulales bacterium]|nr:cation diffusion facilitator family transporter [Pirellulales bacterium]
MGHHHHAHGDGCHHGRGVHRRRLAIVLVLALATTVAEIVGSWLADSLALWADAGHMFSDAAALGLSLFAAWIAERPPTPEHSYGYRRAEILAALANGTTLIAISIVIFVEAVMRFSHPHPVEGGWMIAIAFGSLLSSIVGMALLHSGKEENLNVRGAWLHMMTDAVGTLAAAGAGGLIWAFGWEWADPVASILIGMLVIYSSWALMKEAIAILMERTPGDLDIEAVRAALAGGPGVREVHDLHAWTITSGMVALSAHVIVADDQSPPATLRAIRKALHEGFGLDHVTIQVETEGDCACSPHTDGGCVISPQLPPAMRPNE